MSEREYYTNSPYVNFCKLEGYLEKQEDEAERLRMLAYALGKFQEGKQTITDIWPLWRDKKGESVQSWSETPKEMIEKIKKEHKI